MLKEIWYVTLIILLKNTHQMFRFFMHFGLTLEWKISHDRFQGFFPKIENKILINSQKVVKK